LVGSDREQWLRIVIEAVTRVIEDGANSDDPLRQTIIEDARELRERLTAELAASIAGSDPAA
jgi:hypothetical protein